MTDSPFQGDRKVPLRSPLAAIEKRFINWYAPRFPRSIEGYHLTLLTAVWSAGLVLFGWMAGRWGVGWLWGASVMLALQWFTDSFDGALGRLRDTGIPRWGYYMDHFLDFVFMTCIFVGYAFLVPEGYRYMLFAMAFFYACMMVSSFLAYGALGEFQITYFGLGPTEVRLLFIALNAAIVWRGVDLLVQILPWAVALFALFLAAMVHQTQRRIWAVDMREHRREKGE